MPPKKTGKRLTKAQIELLRDWIAQGAEFKEHWAYLPPERPALAPGKGEEAGRGTRSITSSWTAWKRRI